MKIHIVAALVVCLSGLYLNINLQDWINLILCIGLVISAELFNTAIEKVMDLLHPEYNPKVKVIKDVSAGAVLIVSIVAVIVGCVVFLKYL